METVHIGRRIFFILFFLVVVVVVLGALRNVEEREVSELVRIGEVEIPVEVADTIRTRTKGLSGRESLEMGAGMLFIFTTPDYYSFWMKDMRFPIDVIWISRDLRVVGVERGLVPESYPEAYRPSVPIQYVLEVNGGFVDISGIEVGDRATFIP